MKQDPNISLAQLDDAVQACEAFVSFVRPIMTDTRITSAEFNTYMDLKRKLDLAMIPIASLCHIQKVMQKIVITTPESSV
jgi:hypothetical protein